MNSITKVGRGQEAAIEVVNQNGLLLVDSRLIAARLGLQHESLIKTIKKYESRMEQRFGCIRFEIGVPETPTGNPPKYALLTEQQATVLMTFSKNTEEVIDCKLELVEAFDKAKQVILSVIPALSEKLHLATIENDNLRMALEIEKLRDKAFDRQDARILMHGVPTTLLLEGKSDAVVEVDRVIETTIDPRSNSAYSGQSLVAIKDHMKKICGVKIASGAEVERRLEQLGESGLIATRPITVPHKYIPTENLDKAYALLKQGDQQLLL